MPCAFTAPHHQATAIGQQLLNDGATAIEAMVAAAAMIATVYPHMNGLGGDGFWLISEPGKAPVAIDACGTAAAKATLRYYQQAGLTQIPERGPLSCVTMAGAVAGWQQALAHSAQWQPQRPLSELFAPAIARNRQGVIITASQHQALTKIWPALTDTDGLRRRYQQQQQIKPVGSQVANPKLADTLAQLAQAGLNDFYHGDVGHALAQELQHKGALLSHEDFLAYQPQWVNPLNVATSKGTFTNLPAPTQGVASLLILALFDRLYETTMSEEQWVHLLVECTKQAFLERDSWVTDPSRLADEYHQLLAPDHIDQLAAKISLQHALPWPRPAAAGDTIWMGACDQQGRMVSYIQSLYWEWGSGVYLDDTGIVWNNRGTSFQLDTHATNHLQPGLRPFHTLNPAYGELADGRRIVYGTMGGEGQPQTQAALLTRYLYRHHTLADAIAAPRWLLGRTWGTTSHDLKLERSLAERLQAGLTSRGHQCAVVDDNSELMGHAGAVVRHPDHHCTAATDPRSDGLALCATAGHALSSTVFNKESHRS